MKSSHPYLKYFVFVALTMLPVSFARAALIVDVIDMNLPTNSTGFVDVMIYSTGTDDLNAINFDFVLSEVGNPVGVLEFVNPQPEVYADPNYVFFNETDASTFIVQVLDADEYRAGDSTLLLNDVTVDTTPKLFARLAVRHFIQGGGDPASAVGNQYQISLRDNIDINALESFYLDSQASNKLRFDNASFTPGTLTITAAVPEPRAIAALLSLMVVAIIVGRRRVPATWIEKSQA